MISYVIANKLDPKVLELVIASGAIVMTRKEGETKYGQTGMHPDSWGSYCHRRDVIYMDDCLNTDKTNMVMLHELVHWTGVISRAARLGVMSLQAGMGLDLVGRKEEEEVAQYGAQLLLNQCGLGDEQSIQYTNCYLESVFSGSITYPKMAQEAIDYLNKLLYAYKNKEQSA